VRPSAVPDSSDSGDRFGYALVAARFNGQDRSSLAIGVPGEALGSGAVIVLYGESGVTGLGTAHAEKWDQDTGLAGAAEAGDGFGSSLAAGDFNGDSFWDLAVGIPLENIEGIADNAGAVQVLYGDHGWLGLEANGNQLWWQELLGYTSELDDWFGFGLAGK
jgi:hypothetical protein